MVPFSVPTIFDFGTGRLLMGGKVVACLAWGTSVPSLFSPLLQTSNPERKRFPLGCLEVNGGEPDIKVFEIYRVFSKVILS